MNESEIESEKTLGIKKESMGMLAVLIPTIIVVFFPESPTFQGLMAIVILLVSIGFGNAARKQNPVDKVDILWYAIWTSAYPAVILTKLVSQWLKIEEMGTTDIARRLGLRMVVFMSVVVIIVLLNLVMGRMKKTINFTVSEYKIAKVESTDPSNVHIELAKKEATVCSGEYKEVKLRVEGKSKDKKVIIDISDK